MPRFSAWVFLLGLLTTARAWGQGAAYGDWQLHLPARRPLTLAEAGSRLYVADESSFYFYDKDLHSTQLLSRRDGLSDVGVGAVAYDSASAQVVVVYRNGNIDLLGASGAVRNVTDLLRKESQTAKVINQVQIYNGLAYINSSLGVVVLDLAKREVRDTYSAIGAGGKVVNAYATVVLHDTIYAATSVGILRGRLNAAVNLLDYRSWTPELPTASTTQLYQQLAAYRGHLVAGSSYRGIDYLAGVGAARRWRSSPNGYGNEVRRLRPSAGQLLVAFEGSALRRFDAPTGALADVLPLAAGGSVRDALRTADGTLYVASYDKGLLRFAPGTITAPEEIRPNAPETTAAYGLLANAATNTVDVFSGGYSGDNGLQFGNRGGFYEYKDRQWTNYTATIYPSATDFPNLLDVSRGARTPDGTLYVASYGNGLLQWQGPGKFKQFTAGTPGSLLRSSLEASDPNYLNFVRVTDVAADPSGSYLWVVNRHQRTNVPGLLRFRPASATWKAGPSYGFDNLDRVVVDNFGNPWATQSRKGGFGVVAYDTASQRAFSFTVGSGLPSQSSNTLYSIARDRTGDIWIGTAAGVAVFNDPSQLISAGANGTATGSFAQPRVARGVGTGFQTLYNETVRCIAIDGANRKWFGTPNGLWLFNADATEALLNFTTANSPLPSNSIVDIAVNDKTGEVFVATEAGVVSYQGAASLTEGAPSCAQVSPNPVRPEFAGTVGISGVVNNAQVRITDVAGHLVYSTRAAGGTVTWNLTDTAGRRVRSGVYLVLTADADGKNTCVSKVAVLSK